MEKVTCENLSIDDINGVAAAVSSDSKPPPVHVPPRIDPDLYQADVPDWSPNGDDLATPQLTDSGLHSKSVHSEMHCNSVATQGFLTVVRNLLDPVHPHGQSFWSASQSEIPLETDVLALEYLSSYEYDVDKALFNLFCDFGRGKDAVFAGKSLSVVERTASNVIFTDLKERLLKIPPQTLFGAYYGSFNASGPLRLPATTEDSRHASASASIASALLAAAPNGSIGDNSKSDSTNSAAHHATKHAIFSSIITQPMQQARAEELLALPLPRSLPAAPAAAEEPASKKARSSTGTAVRKKDDTKTTASSTSSTTANLTEDETALSDALLPIAAPVTDEPFQRVSKQRGASSDKVELRRKWLSVAQRASQMLNGTKKATLAEAQALLDLACGLPPHHNIMSMAGSSVVSSSSAAAMSTAAVAIATEEAALLDNVNVMLGKLVKALLTTRYWVSEVRDAIYCCSLDAVILSHQTELRNKSGRKGTAESLMNGLRELLRESEAHVLCADPEQRLLKETIAATGTLLQHTRSVLRECCAWESQPSLTASRPEAVHRSLVVRGRPALYTAAQIRSLLLQHIAAVSEAQPFVPSPVAKRPSMQEVGELIVRAQLNPVKISEAVYLENVHRQGVQLVDTAATILTRAAQLAVAKSRLTLDRVRYPLTEVQALLEDMHSFPFRSEEVDALQSLVSRAEAWRKEVASISGGALGGSDSAEQGSKAQNNRTSRKTETANKPIPLKKVESLIAEGERFPFELKDELEVLRDKKQQAKMWLEKLKRSFVPTKVGISRSKKNAADDANFVAEKLSLSDMKMMVSEGESLYQQPLEDDAMDFGAAGAFAGALSAGRPAASARTVNRELDRAQAVVETAEDWIARVRDLLMGDDEGHHMSDDGGEPNRNAGLDGAAHEGEAERDGEAEGSESETSEDAQERTMQMLRAMLEEAEGMPVSLDECGLLRCHLQALEWAARVRPLLSVALPSVADQAEEAASVQAEQLQQEGGEDGDDKAASKRRSTGGSSKRDGKQAQKKASLPRLAEMQQFAKDISRIRANMNSAGSSDLPLKPLPEETKCLTLVADAERWLNKVKKILQGNSVRKGSKLSRLRLLCEEGSSIPIHFETELRPLKNAIAAANQWAETYRAQLAALGLFREEQADPSVAALDSAEDVKVRPGDGADGERKRKLLGDDTPGAAAVNGQPHVDVSYAELGEMVASASQLVAEFDLTRGLLDLSTEVERWVTKVSKICKVEVRTEKRVDAQQEDDAADSGARATKRPRKGEDAAVAELNNDNGAGDAGDSRAASTDVAGSSASTAGAGSSSFAMVSVAQLDQLVAQGKTFGVDLSAHVLRLEEVKRRAENWERAAQQYVAAQFSEQLKKLLVEYKRLITDFTAAENGAIFSFITRKPSAMTNHNIAKGYKEEGAVFLKASHLLAEILAVRIQGESIGVVMPYHRTIVVYIRLLEWVIESRNVSCYQTVNRRKSQMRPKSRGDSLVTSWEGWEDIREPVQMKHWGDVDEDLLFALVDEGEDMLSRLYNVAADERIPGLVVHYSRGLLAAAIEFRRVEEPAADAEGAADGGEEDHQSEDDGAEGAEGADEDAEGEHKADQKSKKRKAPHQATSSTSPLSSKTTRAASGITKKKVDSEFAETVNLQHYNSFHNTAADDAPKANKRAKNGAGPKATNDDSADASAPVAVTVPEVPSVALHELDLERTGRRAALSAFLHSLGEDSTLPAADAKLTPGMAQLLDLWIRVLKVYALRLRASNKWVAEARALLAALGSGLVAADSDTAVAVPAAQVKGNTGEEIESLLAVAAQEGIQNKYRFILEESVHNSKEWLKQAEKMRLPGAALLTMDELKLFLKAGESVIYVSQRNAELQDLRGELRKAKQWKARLDKSGFDTATASTELLSELVAEAKLIRVNLTEHTDSIVQVNKTYCLCRQPYHGTMVGCDTCEEWYHFQCVGLSSSQAEKCAKYVCVRCSLKNSFCQSANMVAQLTNKWMNCAEHFRRREETYQKLAKKLYKDEKELQKVKANLKALLDGVPASSLPSEVLSSAEAALNGGLGIAAAAPTAAATSSSAASNGTPADAADTDGASSATEMEGVTSSVLPIGPADTGTAATATAAPSAVTGSAVDRIIAARREVEALANTVTKAVAEKEKLTKAITTETALHREIFRWMQAMQELLWPSTDEQVALGRPVGPSDAALSASSEVSVLDYNRALLARLPSMLPVGLVHMERAAALVGILTLDDVTVVLEAFRWMSWTNLCLHMLRLPPTTPALRRLMDAAKGMRCADDKIVKLLLGVQQRAVAWKVKARKTLNPQQKKLDLARFQTLALEGIGLPFTSRIKDKLRGILSAHPQGWAAPTDATASDGADGTAKGSKRAAKPNSAVVSMDAASSSTAAGGSSESWASRIIVSGVEECVSSDEEDAYDRVCGEMLAGNSLATLPAGLYKHEYPLVSTAVMALAPDQLWPPQLLVARRRPSISAVNSANASASASTSGGGAVTTGTPVEATESRTLASAPIAPAVP